MPKSKKKKTRRRWTGEEFALYLLNKNIKYVLPTTTAKEIHEDLKNEIKIGEKRTNTLLESPEFKKTVKREFYDQIRDKENLRATFWALLKNYVDKELKASRTSAKAIEMMGQLSGEYYPKAKVKPPAGLTPAQKARLIHNREQAKAKEKKEEKNGK